ncbi:MAG: FIST C-terminal domain-containing protein [Oculatellaceae cyanobacterium Prado106]|jgi:small ligand-binding sensory domain FIST|nr:FIST C-terminal domain-containing protein [Oculatellaceae cyanobacterium Prado106]
MEWASALSTRPSLEAAVEEVVEQAQQRLKHSADLGILFISSAFASEYSRLMPLLQERLSLPALIGCSGGGVIGVDHQGDIQEIETGAALSLTLAHLPDVQVKPFHITTAVLPDLDGPPDAWIELMGVYPEAEPHFILLADPMSGGTSELLQGLDFAYPGAIKVGGLADVGAVGNHSSLFCNDKHYREGLVGVALSGNVKLETIVAQGCRPIGQPYRVAEGERNILLKLEEQSLGSPTQTPLEILQALFEGMNEADRSLAQRSLFVGVAQSAFKQDLEQGDFLIRTVLGVDPRTGAIAIGDRVRPGQRIQFHLRDAEASAEDLTLLLERYPVSRDPAQPLGALLFACLGRGESLYLEPNFDSRKFSHYFPNIPLSGFFCNGEIGPVGDATFLHGYTSVFGIVSRKG